MNVPIQNGIITDDYRITSILPTLQHILKKNPKRVMLVSHLGRPQGWDEKYSLQIVIPVLEKYLGEKVGFLEKGIGEESEKKMMEEDVDCRIWVMENIRFYKEETDYENQEINEEFQQQFLQMGDMYVNDAFGCSHRKHFSICGFSGRMPCYYGKCIQKELEAFNTILENPEKKKIMMILGGAKIDDKVPILQKLCKKVKTIYLGGGILSNMIEGMNQKNKDALEEAKKHCNVVIATDGINQHHQYLRWNYQISCVPPENKIFDIGSQSLHELYQLIQQHDIILWNGTMGWTENGFIHGTDSLITILKQSSCQVIVGGGDTAGYVCTPLGGDQKNRLSADFVNEKKQSFYHISTGGGASIEYISQGSLIGLESIFDS
jgi:phosphoglycerate kinase